MVARGVVVSSRKPDALRFGVHPLTTSHADLWRAVQILRDLLATGDWRDPRYNGPVI
jgi:kynureninase